MHFGGAARFDGVYLVGAHVGDDIDVARDEFGGAGRGFGDDAPDDALELGGAQVEAWDALQDHAVVAHPLDEAVGAGADRHGRGRVGVHRLVGVLAVDIDFGDHPERDGVVLVDDDGDVQVAVGAGVLVAQRAEHEARRVAGVAVLGVGGALEGVGHVLGGQGLAVVAGEPFAQPEGDFGAFLVHFKGFGEVGNYFPVGGRLVERSPDVLSDVGGGARADVGGV
jgi:hypothetical protein